MPINLKKILWSEGQKAVVVTVIALVFNPFSVIIGYTLARVLARPRVEIQDVHVDRLPEPIHLDKPACDNLKIVLTKKWFREHDLNACQMALHENSFNEDCMHDIDETKPEIESEYGSRLEKLSAEISAFSAAEPGKPVVVEATVGAGIPANGGMGDFNRINAENPIQMKNILDVIKAQAESERSAYRALVQLLESAKKGTSLDKPLSGDIVLTVRLTNTGDSNAIIPKNGILTVSDRQIKVFAKKSIIVKARDAEEVEMHPITNENVEGDISWFRQMVRKSGPIAYQLSWLDGSYKGYL